MNDFLLSKLACPYDHESLIFQPEKHFNCQKCHRTYPILTGDIPNFLPDELRLTNQQTTTATKPTTEINSHWKPGLRYWNPGKLINFLRFGQGSGRLTDKKEGETLLDVGCGGNAQGDVNTDIYIPEPLPKNFVLSSAEMLPFKNDSFHTVRSAYVIEHNPYPTEMLQEHYRISQKNVLAYTDNSDWLGAIVLRILNTGYIFHDEHYFKWSKEYFEHLLDRLGFSGQVIVFNASPSLIIKATAILGRLPRVGPLFYRDLLAKIKK